MLESLLEALAFSPDNIPLKLQVGKLYKEQGDFENAEKHLMDIIHLDSKHQEAKYLLASCFHSKNRVDAAMVLLEEITLDNNDIRYFELLCYCQLHQKDFAEARQTYQNIIEIQPEYNNADFDEYLKVTTLSDNDFTDKDALSFLTKSNTSFQDVGGMEKVKEEISLPCVIFIDEIDALGANRNDIGKSAGRTVINQFLAELDGMESDNDGILVLGATNAPWYLDPAFRRPGRFDRIIFVSPPDEVARKAIFELQLQNKPAGIIDYNSLAKKSQEFSGADIQAAVDRAIEAKLQASFKDGIPKPLETKDLLKGIKNSKPSTKEWFRSAKNYALYANDSGLYDEILDYLNIKK